MAESARKARELRTWHEHMQRSFGYETTWIAPADMPRWIASPRFQSAVHDPLGGHLHPLKYSLGLARADGWHSGAGRCCSRTIPGCGREPTSH